MKATARLLVLLLLGLFAATPAVAAAVLDAIKPLGVTELDMPLTPLRVWQAIQAAGNGGGAA